MNIYVRKIDNQAINKQISILKETVENFFESKESFTITGKNSSFSGVVKILLATDPRLGGDIKKIIKKEGNMEIGDLLLITKVKNQYILEIVKPGTSKFNVINSMFYENERHLEITRDSHALANIDETKPYLVGYNKIYYGIPGCGKSYHIEHKVLENVDKESNVFRTTFYLDYSNSDFIGQIYPVIEKDKNNTDKKNKDENDKDGNNRDENNKDGNNRDENNKEKVTYKAIPGPFTKALARAYKNLNNKDEETTMIYLVIEEINRGNAAAIFGDLFQLLDRLDKNYDGRVEGDSEYPINNEFIESYLKECNIALPDGQNKIFIPHNLTILATMNTSDQNVFPLDTAFKRRWDRERIVTDWESVDAELKDMYIPFTNYTWEKFAKTVNKKMISNSDEGIILEDKQLGPYFINKDVLVEKSNIKNANDKDKRKLRKFVNNVIDYLYSDVTKFEHSLLFKNDYTSYDEIYDAIIKFDEKNEFCGDHNLTLNVFDDMDTENHEEELSSEEN